MASPLLPQLSRSKLAMQQRHRQRWLHQKRTSAWGHPKRRTSHRWLIGDVYGRPQVDSLWLSRQIHQHARRQMRCTWKFFDRLRPTINRADNGPRHMATMATSQTPERNEV